MIHKTKKKGAQRRKGAAIVSRGRRYSKLRPMGNKAVVHGAMLYGHASELDASSLAAVEEAAAEKLLEAAEPSEVKHLCDRYGLRREDLGRMTGFSIRALAGWSSGKLPSEPAKRRLHEIRRLLDSLAEVVKSEAIAPWLRQRNPAFGNMTPIQVIEVGEIDRLWQMVYHMGSDSAD